MALAFDWSAANGCTRPCHYYLIHKIFLSPHIYELRHVRSHALCLLFFFFFFLLSFRINSIFGRVRFSLRSSWHCYCCCFSSFALALHDFTKCLKQRMNHCFGEDPHRPIDQLTLDSRCEKNERAHSTQINCAHVEYTWFVALITIHRH